MIIKASPKLEQVLRSIFDFIILRDFISRYNTKRLMKCTMPRRNKNEHTRTRTRARGFPRASPAFGYEGMFNSGQGVTAM